MLGALAKALAQISDPAFRRVFLRSVLASVVIFAVLWIAAWYGLTWAGEGLADWIAGRGPGDFWVRAVEWLVGAVAVAGVLITSFLLFPAVMVLVMSLLLEDIAVAVEGRHYPDLPAARRQPWREVLWGGVVFALVSLAVNLLALPLYLLLLFVPPLNLFVFYLINGYLLGREYFELVAVRRYDLATVKRLRRGYRGRLLLAGAVIAFLVTLPLVNLVTPIVATGFMLHVFEGLRRSPGFATRAAAA